MNHDADPSAPAPWFVDRQSPCVGGVELRPITRGDWPRKPPPVARPKPPAHLFRTFAGLAVAAPERYAAFAARYGSLPCGSADGVPYDEVESLLLWRWHAERMAYLIRVLDLWRAVRSGRWKFCPDLLAALYDLRAEPIPDAHRWRYLPESTMLDSTEAERDPGVHLWDDSAVRGVTAAVWIREGHPFQWYQRLHGEAGWKWESKPMDADAPRVYHPFHEGASPLAYLPGARFVRMRGSPAFEFSVRAAIVRHAFTPVRRNALPERVAAGQMAKLLRAALADGIGLVAPSYWKLRVEDPINRDLSFFPQGVLGTVYEQLSRSASGVELKIPRLCECCGEPLELDSRSDRRTCGERCRKAKLRATKPPIEGD